MALLAGLGFVICFASSATVMYLLRSDDTSDSKATDPAAEVLVTEQRPNTVDEAQIADDEVATPSLDVGVVMTQRERGDSYLLAGNPQRALIEYTEVARSQHPYIGDELRYRMALCYEATQSFNRALNEYQTLATASKTQTLINAAKLGQGRVLLHLNRAEIAKKLLWEWLLESADEQNANDVSVADATHLLAYVLVAELRRGQPTDFLADDVLAFAELDLSPAEMLNRYVHTEGELSDSAAPASRPSQETVQDRLEIQLVQQFGDSPETAIFNSQTERQPIALLIEQMCAQAKIEVKWSAAARESVSSRFTNLYVANMSLAMILDGLLGPLNATWTIADKSIQIRAIDEIDVDAYRHSQLQLCFRVLSHATLMFPNHPYTPEALVNLGNLALLRGESSQALSSYQEALRKFPRTHAAAHANFNLGKLHLQANRRSESIKALYFVVDDHFPHPFTSAAYVLLSRLFLGNDQSERAVKPAQRGIALAPDDATKAAAALCLASAHLLSQRPHAANTVLMEQRSAVKKSKYANAGALVDSYARHVAASTPARKMHAGRALIAAVMRAKPTEFAGEHGYLLLARANHEIKLLNEAKALLIAGLQQPCLGDLRNRIKAELALYHLEANETEQAQILYEELAELDGDIRVRSQAHLAEIAYRERDNEACIDLCIELQSHDEYAKPALMMLARVYERSGQHELAAQCLAGYAPKSSLPEPAE